MTSYAISEFFKFSSFFNYARSIPCESGKKFGSGAIYNNYQVSECDKSLLDNVNDINKYNNCNLALYTGMTYNKSCIDSIIVIDLDLYKSNELKLWWNSFKENYPSYYKRFVIAETPSGGIHLYFRERTKLQGKNNIKFFGYNGDGIDIKADGGVIMFVGSYRDDEKGKGYYKWINQPYNENKLPLFPAFMKDEYLTLNFTDNDIENVVENEKINNDVSNIEFEEVDEEKQVRYDPKEKLSEILNIFKNERVEDYHLWMMVVNICKNTGFNNYNDEDYLKDICYDWSKKSDKYNDKSFESLWNSLKHNRYNVSSLYKLAKMDNINLYNEWKEKYINGEKNELFRHRALLYKLSQQDGVADLYIKDHIDDIKLLDKTGNGLFWNNDKKIYNEISKVDISVRLKKFIETKLEPISKYIKTHPNIKKQELESISKHYKLIKNPKYLDLNNLNKITVYIINDKQNRLYHPEFKSLINTPSHILPLKDGKCIDMKLMKIRNRTKEDVFTFEIDRKLETNQEYLNVVREFMSIIMKDNKEDTKYLQTTLGFLITGEQDRKFRNCIGKKARNAKSTIFELMMYIFSDKLVSSVDKSIIIKAKSKLNEKIHGEHIAPMVGKRRIYFSETEEGDELNIGLIKKLSGGDEIRYKKNYGEDKGFVFQGHLVIFTNKQIQMDISDQATKDRILYLLFEQRFVEAEEHIPGENALANQNLCMEMRTKYANAFFTYVMEGAFEYYKNGLKSTKNIKDNQRKQLTELDSFQMFINEKIIKQDETDTDINEILINDLYEHYKEFCKDTGMINPFKFQRSFTEKIKKTDLILSEKRRIYYLKGYNII